MLRSCLLIRGRDLRLRPPDRALGGSARFRRFLCRFAVGGMIDARFLVTIIAARRRRAFLVCRIFIEMYSEAS